MAHSTLGHSLVARTLQSPIARAAYWLGVYAIRRNQWCNTARDNKAAGRDYQYAVNTARGYNHDLVDCGIKLRNLNATY